MVLSLEGHLGHPNEAFLPSAFLVDYVRTYYNSDFAGAPTDGVYHLVNAESVKALAVVQGNDENASQLIQTSGRGRETSWLLKRNYDGTYSILSRQNGKSADLTADRNVTENPSALNDEWIFERDKNIDEKVCAKAHTFFNRCFTNSLKGGILALTGKRKRGSCNGRKKFGNTESENSDGNRGKTV